MAARSRSEASKRSAHASATPFGPSYWRTSRTRMSPETETAAANTKRMSNRRVFVVTCVTFLLLMDFLSTRGYRREGSNTNKGGAGRRQQDGGPRSDGRALREQLGRIERTTGPVIVHPADCHIAITIHAPAGRLLQSPRMTTEQSGRNTPSRNSIGQCRGFVPADVTPVEPPTVRIRQADLGVIQEYQGTDTLARQGRCYLADRPTEERSASVAPRPGGTSCSLNDNDCLGCSAQSICFATDLLRQRPPRLKMAAFVK